MRVSVVYYSQSVGYFRRNSMLRILIIVLIIYAIVQIPFIIKAYLGRRKYQQKIKDGERRNREIMKDHEKKDDQK